MNGKGARRDQRSAVLVYVIAVIAAAAVAFTVLSAKTAELAVELDALNDAHLEAVGSAEGARDAIDDYIDRVLLATASPDEGPR